MSPKYDAHLFVCTNKKKREPVALTAAGLSFATD